MIALFIPPVYSIGLPPLGTPALVGFLNSKGINVVQGDLNMCYFDYIKNNKLERTFTPEYRRDKIRKKSIIIEYYNIKALIMRFGMILRLTQVLLSLSQKDALIKISSSLHR